MNDTADDEELWLKDLNSGSTIEGFSFRSRVFGDCSTFARKPELRSTFRRITVTNCTQFNCSLRSAILDEIIVDGLKSKGHFLTVRGAAFRHVELRGKIDRIWATSDFADTDATMQCAFDAANAEFYSTVDWALDITNAEFKVFELDGIPTHLIRHDPQTQFIVKKANLIDGKWKKLQLRFPWQATFTTITESWADGTVLVAGKRSKSFEDELADLKLMRKAGIAEEE